MPQRPHCFSPPFFLRLTGRQMMRIGYYSLPVVGLTAFFTGGVLALQIYIGGSRFNAEGIVASIVVLGITRELDEGQSTVSVFEQNLQERFEIDLALTQR